MRCFKKCLIASALFLCIVSVFSAFFLHEFFSSECLSCLDSAARQELSGSLDMLIVGSCQGMNGFNTKIIDEELGVNSYNLCGNHMSPAGEVAIIEEELARNPVKYVIIDIDYDTLSYTNKDVKASGNLETVPRLSGLGKKLSFFLKNIRYEDWDVVYSTYLYNGILTAIDKVNGTYTSAVDRENKGFTVKKAVDQTLDSENILDLKNSQKINTAVVENNDNKLRNLIDICIDSGAKVLLVTTPSSDSYVWLYDGWDELHSNVAEIADEFDVEYIDFNLLKNRNEIFDDAVSFRGKWSLADTGAEAFSLEFSKIFNLRENGMDISDLFYETYEQAKNNSVYAKGQQ